MSSKLQCTTKLAISATKRSIYSGELSYSPQGVPEVKSSGEDFVAKLLDRRWKLSSPESKIQQIILSSKKVKHGGEVFGDFSLSNNSYPCLGPKMIGKENQEQSVYVVRDDLLHPLVNGNKSRKLDALLPLVEDHLVTDVVTCGGCQSAHAAAVAVSCAERGIESHLLLRGEQPEIQTGYNLISTMYGNVTYVPRSIYSNREKMLRSHADHLAGGSGHVLWFDDILEDSLSRNNFSLRSQKEDYISDNSRKVVIVNEGAGDVVALLGVIRLMEYLSRDHLFGKERRLKLIVDSGTGTTAVGLGLGALCLGLPWEITAVMLADTVDGYRRQEKRLISNFKRHFGFPWVEGGFNETDESVVHWVERQRPRKFGNILEGEIEACQEIAQRTGILVDPVYTLAAWEMAITLSEKEAKEETKVVMLHTGGTLGMFGLAQRYRSYFSKLND